jgi:GH24 family phage-related lysozyme (muramidase)
MASETDELRLTVTLVDNASEGVKKIEQSLKSLSGGQNATAFQQMRKHTEELQRQVRPLSEDFKKAGESVLPFVRGIGGAATGMLAFGYAAEKGLDALAKYSGELVKLNQLSIQTGTGAATLKSMREQMEQWGLSAGQVARNTQGLAQSMYQMTLVMSPMRQKLLEGLRGEPLQAMQEFLAESKRLAESGDMTAYANHAEEGLAKITKSMEAAGLSQQRIAERRKQFGETLGIPDLNLLNRFQAVTAEEEKAQKARDEAAQKYLALTTQIGQEWKKITDAWFNQAITSSPLMESLKWIDEKMQAYLGYLDKVDKINKEHPAATGLQSLNPWNKQNEEHYKALGKETGVDTSNPLLEWWKGRHVAPGGGGGGWGDKEIPHMQHGGIVSRATLAMIGEGGPEAVIPLGALGGGGDEHSREMKENTEQLKQLNDALHGIIYPGGGGGGAVAGGGPGGPGGGGPGGMLSALTGGGGGGPGGILGSITGGGMGGLGGMMRGLGGLPGFGGRGGGGGGGGAPNGSDVGPGTGEGAGTTPAVGGGGGGAVAGGGGPDWFTNFVKKTEGFEPKAKWDYAQYSSGYGTKAGYAGEPITREEADKRLQSELGKAGAAVDKINPNLDPGTKAALTDLAFNAGPGALSGIRGAIKSGDTAAIKQWLPEHFRTAGGKESKGLIARRAAEASWVGNKGLAGTGSTPAGSGVGTEAGEVKSVPAKFQADLTAMTLAGAQPHNIHQYMLAHGINLSEATCGQFMASVVKEHGGQPPKDPAVASNWNQFGGAQGAGYSDDPNAINIAVKQGTGVGATGSHVTGAVPIRDASGNITGYRGVGANQFNPSGPEHGVGQYGRDVVSSQPIRIGDRPGEYHIRHQIVEPQIARADVDRQMTEHRVVGTGQLDVNVNAPRGTFAKASGGGLFKKTTVNRRAQMEAAATSSGEG